MSAIRPRGQVSNSAKQSSSISLLESLADARISILYLARQAKEAKNNALAKDLTEKSRSLRREMTRIRQTATTVWTKETQSLITRAGTVQSELAKLIQDTDKSAKKIRVFTRALSAVSTLLALAKKVL